MKKVLLFFALFMSLFATSRAYDFSAVSPSGHTLYYYIRNDGASVSVVWPNANASVASDTWLGYTKPSGDIIIPNFVSNGSQTYTVNAIGTAFYQCTDITSVVIADSIQSISVNAFNGCTGLGSITIPNAIKRIEKYAFANCIGLTTVYFNADYCTTMGDYDKHVFDGCTSLTNAVFGNNVKILPAYTFFGCSSLTTANIPDSVVYIGDCCFRYCSNLTITNLIIPSKVTYLGNDAFGSCYNITGSVSIPKACTYIGKYCFYDCTGLSSIIYDADSVGIVGSEGVDYANFWYGYPTFSGCTNITEIIIGKNVRKIADQAFLGCSNLAEITSLASEAPLLGTNVFGDIDSNIPVYIPCGSSNSYQSAWIAFSNFIDDVFPSFAAQSADESMGTVQVLNEPTCTNPNAVLNAVPASGYRFDHWSTGSTQNPYSLTVTTDTVITAYFVSEGGTEGIEDINADDVNIYVKDRRIVVDGTTEEYRIYDITGRIVAHSHSAEVSSPLSCGVYLVKVGLRPARKVVVR